jgi:hypothetical protein
MGQYPNWQRQQPYQHQNYQPPYQPPKNTTMKTLSIVFFAIGFFFHLLSFTPLVGILFAVFAVWRML